MQIRVCCCKKVAIFKILLSGQNPHTVPKQHYIHDLSYKCEGAAWCELFPSKNNVLIFKNFAKILEQNTTSENNNKECNVRSRCFRILSKYIKIHGPEKVAVNLKSYKTIQPITKNKANTSRFYEQPDVPSDYIFQFHANFEISNSMFKQTKNYYVEM